MMSNDLLKIIGNIPNDKDSWTKRNRFHQSWWRTFVLNLPQGDHPIKKGEKIANTIPNDTDKNFLNENIKKAVYETLREREQQKGKGIIDVNRLKNNLLSSQPLAFNFFGEFKFNLDLALIFIQKIIPEITKVNKVMFEFGDVNGILTDNSAFDIALEVQKNEDKGIIGFECKYTDTFSDKLYGYTTDDKRFEVYKKLFDHSVNHFKDNYFSYVGNKDLNQLFRNELIAQSLQTKDYKFVITGLFCSDKDKYAIETGNIFKNKIVNSDEHFIILTFQEFIKYFQQMELSWEQRELSMLLWSRYCGLELSENIFAENN